MSSRKPARVAKKSDADESASSESASSLPGRIPRRKKPPAVSASVPSRSSLRTNPVDPGEYDEKSRVLRTPFLHLDSSNSHIGKMFLELIASPPEVNRKAYNKSANIPEDGSFSDLIDQTEFLSLKPALTTVDTLSGMQYEMKLFHDLYYYMVKMVPLLDIDATLKWSVDEKYIHMFRDHKSKTAKRSGLVDSLNFEFRKSEVSAYFYLWTIISEKISRQIEQTLDLIKMMQNFTPGDPTYCLFVHDNAMEYYTYMRANRLSFKRIVGWLEKLQPYFDIVIALLQNLIQLWTGYIREVCGNATSFLSFFLQEYEDLKGSRVDDMITLRVKADRRAEEHIEKIQTLDFYSNLNALAKLPDADVLGRKVDTETLSSRILYRYSHLFARKPIVACSETSNEIRELGFQRDRDKCYWDTVCDFFKYSKPLGRPTDVKQTAVRSETKGHPNSWVFVTAPAPLQFNEVFSLATRAGSLYTHKGNLVWIRKSKTDGFESKFATMNTIVAAINYKAFFNFSITVVDV